MNIIFKKCSGKNLKICILNACTKTSETLWKKQEKAIIYNIITVSIKNPCGEKIKKQTSNLALALPH
jgi:hypothetical protein